MINLNILKCIKYDITYFIFDERYFILLYMKKLMNKKFGNSINNCEINDFINMHKKFSFK